MPSINLFPDSFVEGATFDLKDLTGKMHHIQVTGFPDGPTQILARGLEPYTIIKVDLTIDGSEDWAKIIFPASYEFEGKFTINQAVYHGHVF